MRYLIYTFDEIDNMYIYNKINLSLNQTNYELLVFSTSQQNIILFTFIKVI